MPTSFSGSRMIDYVSARFPLTEAGTYDARFRWNSEHGEVTPQTEILLQLTNGCVSISEPVEQLDAHRLAEHPKALRDELDHWVGKGMRRRGEGHR